MNHGRAFRTALTIALTFVCALSWHRSTVAQQYRHESKQLQRQLDQAMNEWFAAPQVKTSSRSIDPFGPARQDRNRNTFEQLPATRPLPIPNSVREYSFPQDQLPVPKKQPVVQKGQFPAKRDRPALPPSTGVSDSDLDDLIHNLSETTQQTRLPNLSRALRLPDERLMSMASAELLSRFAQEKPHSDPEPITPPTRSTPMSFSPPHFASDRDPNSSFTRSRDQATGQNVSTVTDHRPARNPVGTNANLPTLAAQPKLGDQGDPRRPQTDRDVFQVPYNEFDFAPDPLDPILPFDPELEISVYEGKTLNAVQRPLIEIGRPWYQLGELKPGYTFLGAKNLVTPQFVVFGDFRTAVSSFEQMNDNQSFWAFELNLFFDFKITSTERFHFNMTPLNNRQNSKFVLDDNFSFDNQLNPDINFGYFEGDLGAMAGGFVGQNLPFDAPFAIGFMPLVFQNGVWAEDAFVGVAATIPARNSPLLDISNADLTFFYGWDEVTTDAFADDNVNIYGIAAFIDVLGGFIEADYAFLEDRDRSRDQSYHNISVGYSRRYGRFISNSVRIIANAGQSTASGPNTADGVLLLIENSLTTSQPMNFVPYFNLFAGFDRPQSAARDPFSGGVLRNTGILFESDGMTGFPVLDDSGNDTWGGAFGFNILTPNFDQQLILEAAVVQTHGNDATRRAAGDQFGLGFRYQLPLTNADILRLDGMMGFYEEADDVNGIRVEWRHKW